MGKDQEAVAIIDQEEVAVGPEAGAGSSGGAAEAEAAKARREPLTVVLVGTISRSVQDRLASIYWEQVPTFFVLATIHWFGFFSLLLMFNNSSKDMLLDRCSGSPHKAVLAASHFNRTSDALSCHYIAVWLELNDGYVHDLRLFLNNFLWYHIALFVLFNVASVLYIFFNIDPWPVNLIVDVPLLALLGVTFVGWLALLAAELTAEHARSMTIMVAIALLILLTMHALYIEVQEMRTKVALERKRRKKEQEELIMNNFDYLKV